MLLARSTIFDEIEKDLLSEDQVITKGLISLRPSLTAASSLELISEIEKQWLAFSKKKEEYFPFLLAAMIILLLEILLRYTVFRSIP